MIHTPIDPERKVDVGAANQIHGVVTASRSQSSRACVHEPGPAERNALDRLRWFGWIEGTTLLVLLLIAVPLKHAFDQPLAVSIVGPVHGLAFVAYLYVAIETVCDGRWAGRDIARVLGAALVPFGTFANDRFLKRRAGSST